MFGISFATREWECKEPWMVERRVSRFQVTQKEPDNMEQR
jgi:hypothetical protein